MQPLKKIKLFFVNHKLLKYLWNKYVLILMVFLVWMLFLDNYSYLEHQKLNKKLDELNGSKSFFEKEIKKDSLEIKQLKNPVEAERYAREAFLMKKDNEEIYIIETDTIKP